MLFILASFFVEIMVFMRGLKTSIPPVEIDIVIVFVILEPLVFQSIVEDVFSLGVTLANYLM